MAQQERPARSLRRDGDGPRYYRDWNAANEAAEESQAGVDQDGQSALIDAPHHLQMIDGIDDNTVETPSASGVRSAIPMEMAPLNVIVPERPTPAPPANTSSKPTVTRMDHSKIQRARRYSDLKAEEEQKKQDEEKAVQRRKASAQLSPPDQSPKTRSLHQTTAKTTELHANIKEIGGKLDETRSNVKNTADALGQNIKNLSERFTNSVVGGIQKMGKNINSLIGRWGSQSEGGTSNTEQDFDDAPLPERQTTAAQQAAPVVAKAPQNPLERVPAVPVVMYAELLKEKVYFLNFNKERIVAAPESLSADQLQSEFVSQALEDIRKCIKLVRDLPDPKEGPYAGIPLSYIFKQVREQDLYFFMHYVLSKPGPFRKKTFKLSEAFATWILKRSASTEISEAFPTVPVLSYHSLYKSNIRFQTFDRKQLVLAGQKTSAEVDALFMERAQEDIRACIKLVEQFPPAEKGPYQGKPLKQIFRYVQPRDIYFFMHYVKSQPEVFQGQNFKFSEAFASWILKRSHETPLPKAK